jgi:hypothetical protein
MLQNCVTLDALKRPLGKWQMFRVRGHIDAR